MSAKVLYFPPRPVSRTDRQVAPSDAVPPAPESVPAAPPLTGGIEVRELTFTELLAYAHALETIDDL